ncbi:MAG: hypothetical protein OXH64_06210 [Rhodospirillaceae bacterium]|nr:hypothetical protein [Rhodospirillaceae bacterium]
MEKVKSGDTVRMLTWVTSVMFALSVGAGLFVLWMAADHNKDNIFCREIADPSAAQRLWIFDCAPDFGNSFEIFGTYFLIVFAVICAIPLSILSVLILLQRVRHRRSGI